MVQKTYSLKGKTVAITRPAGQAEEAGKLIEEKGGTPYYIPAIEIKALSNFAPIKKFISKLHNGNVDYVIFMSTNGAKYLFNAAESLRMENKLKEGLDRTSVIAIGPRTAQALDQDYHVHVSLIPQKYSSEGLIESLKDTPLKGKKIIIPRTSNATPDLTDKLKGMGALVEEVYVYESRLPVDENLKNKFFADLTSGKIDAIVFGSGLSAKNIFQMLSEKASMDDLRKLVNDKVVTVAIGPTTAEALRQLGVKVDLTPQDYLFEDALSLLARHWNSE